MSVVRKFFPEVRLKRLLAGAGGLRVAHALAQAEHQLEEIRGECLAGIDAKIERISELAALGGEPALEQCYVTSNEIYAEAGVFGLQELSAAAHSLCSLLSARDHTSVPAAAIKVHVDTLRALRTPQIEQNDEMRRAVLNELERLARRIAATGSA